MTSRERVRMTLNHKEPDRVPMDLWGSACRLHSDFYQIVADFCGFKEYGPRIRPGTTTEYVDYRLSDLVGADFRHINIGKPDNFTNYEDSLGRIVDEWGIGRTRKGSYNAITYYPFASTDIDSIRTHKWPTPSDVGRTRGLKDIAKDWYENSGSAITATSAVSGIFFELSQYLCGTEEFMMALYTEPDFIEALLEKLTEIIIELNLYYLEPIGDYLEWVEFTEDFGMQKSLFCSPELIKKYFRKPHQELFGRIKKRFPKLKIFLHTCGVVEPIIPELIEWGIDILNPLQPLVEGMDIERIKKTWGKDLVFHGAIDIQQAILGSKEDVENEVRTRIDQLAPGGGYILAPTNHLQHDVPVENFLTLYQYAAEYGKYKK